MGGRDGGADGAWVFSKRFAVVLARVSSGLMDLVGGMGGGVEGRDEEEVVEDVEEDEDEDESWRVNIGVGDEGLFGSVCEGCW